jgi:glutathione S-transferase
MAQFLVHSIPGSPFGRAVLATLIEKGAEFRLIAVEPRSTRAEPHLARHAFGRVPVLEHDGFTLYETQAILRYIDRVVPEPPLSPREPRPAARMDQLLGIGDCYLHQGVGNVIGFQRIVGPRVLGLATNEAAIAEALPRAHVVFAELARLLGDKSYFVLEQPTLADMLLAAHMDFLAQTPEWAALTADRPNIGPWLERMYARRSFRETTWERVVEMARAA